MCRDDTYRGCYCALPHVITRIIQCIQSWGVNSSEIQSALSSLSGICRDYVDSNPAIMSAISSAIALTQPDPLAASSPGGSAAILSTYMVSQVAFTTVAGGCAVTNVTHAMSMSGSLNGLPHKTSTSPGRTSLAAF
jgi:hypothetical protein